MKPRYEQVHVGVDLNGPGGNAFAIIASVLSGLRSIHATKEEIEQFKSEAMSGDYEHLLMVCSEWVDIEYWNIGDYCG